MEEFVWHGGIRRPSAIIPLNLKMAVPFAVNSFNNMEREKLGDV